MLFYLPAFSILAFDQFLKTLVHRSMGVGQSLPFLGKIIKLTYVRNTGAAFSLFPGYSFYLLLISLLAVGVIIYFHRHISHKDYFLQVALAFILGGSLGNLVDRFSRGYVVDYIDFGFWPVFNLADIMINVGVVLLAYRLIFVREDNKK
jgi:signal peptidase II